MRKIFFLNQITFTILLFIIVLSGITYCQDLVNLNPSDSDSFFYRDEMRHFIQAISRYSHQFHPNFIIVPQNGLSLLTTNGEPEGVLISEYLTAIDGVGQEELFFGFLGDDEPTPEDITSDWLSFLNKIQALGKAVLITDYCSNTFNIKNSFERNNLQHFISFASESREMDIIPINSSKPYHENSKNVEKIIQAKNFLYLINPSGFSNKEEMIEDLSQTNYDLLIIDAYFSDFEMFTNEDVYHLKEKINGGKRLILSYLSIGEAENYRYYWQKEWDINPPSWLEEENPDWSGNYKVRYWDKEWREIIFGNPDAYLDKILKAGFDGVYLDLVDSFEYFEELQ
ncbi:MAG TPA: endo alpha-1,4 polygalactosaminidase [Atribacter sp.]|uniref:endo alpha-1,4 polygalactosaminidase n=1 Tax=Atribacter sp. TaxID=2847780 RepID=UPI002C9F0A94|nr:endo alpha-1,4 polygalactosaminidase [Atribacter sp.]HQK83474.1 endo alpha-1,4 polygalactosaminidase [Atribacter sp.]